MERNDSLERYGAGAGPDLAGKLAKYTSHGSYPLYYLTADGFELCADCANAEEAEGEEAEFMPVDSEVNWEDPAFHCHICQRRIESAYAEKP